MDLLKVDLSKKLEDKLKNKDELENKTKRKFQDENKSFKEKEIQKLMKLNEFDNFKSDPSEKLRKFDPENLNKLIDNKDNDDDLDRYLKMLEINRVFKYINNETDINTLKQICNRHNIFIKDTYSKNKILDKIYDFSIKINFDKEDTSYPTEYSKVKILLNDEIVRFINISNISKENQNALILENIQLNTINALMKYNPLIKIDVVELNRDTVQKMAEIYYNKYDIKYKDNVVFYPNMLLDEIISKKCNNLQNIIFADFMGTYTGNHKSYKCIRDKCDYVTIEKDELNAHRHKDPLVSLYTKLYN
jgi:hypothetical protein